MLQGLSFDAPVCCLRGARPYQRRAAAWAQCPGCQAGVKRAPRALAVWGWPSARQQIPLQKGSPHTSPERWVCHEILMPGDFYLLEVVLQVLCCQEGDRRGSPHPLSRSWEHPQVSDVDFLQPNSIFFLLFLDKLLLLMMSVAS